MNKKEITERLKIVWELSKPIICAIIMLIPILILVVLWIVIIAIEIYIGSIIYFVIWILTGKKLYNFIRYKYEKIFGYIF